MLTAALLILLSLLALLMLPVDLVFRVSWRDTWEKDIRLRWAFGLVSARLGADKPQDFSRLEAETDPSRLEGDHAASGSFDFLGAIRQKPFRQRILRFIADCWQALRKRELALRLRLGLGDPADTGQLWAALGPVSGVLAGVDSATISLEPDFENETFELDGSGKVRVIPLQLLYACTTLIVSPTVWRTLRTSRQ